MAEFTKLRTIKTFKACGCEIYERADRYDIQYCPLHKSALKMYEALKDIIEQAQKTKLPLGADLADSINVFGNQALALAKGKEV